MSKIVITGGLGVLAAAVTYAFFRKGHNVVLIDRVPTPVDSVLICIGGVDLSDASAAKTAFDAARRSLGGLTSWSMSLAHSPSKRSMDPPPPGRRCSKPTS